jgi:uncharacterized protein YjbJ (UPF0337 family)
MFSSVNREKNMSLSDKAKAAAKDVEGKIQDTAGRVTGNNEAQAKGKAKQAEADVIKTKENAKDAMKDAVD